ncbi:MAG: TPM domain-containing protein [Rhodospirillaceae bacterium]|nr:TPM domain-containing protein [Rhodospirillaceae bacterium]
MDPHTARCRGLQRRKPRTGLATIAALALFFVFATNAAWSDSTDLPRNGGRVTDEARIISPGVVSELQKLLSTHEKKYSNLVFVVTLTSLRGNDIKTAAHELGRYWNIGFGTGSRNVFFIISPTERQVRIHVGKELQTPLSDAIAARIIADTIVPHFRDGRFEQGILDGARMVVSTLENQGATDELDPGSILFLSLAAGSVFLAIFNIRRRRRRRATGEPNIQHQDSTMRGDNEGGSPDSDGEGDGSGGGSGGW